MSGPQPTLDDLLFVGFNGRVCALHRETGEVLWRKTYGWSGSYVCILPDRDRIFVSCRGYTWAIDPWTGEELWNQPLKGEGTGIPALATMRSAAPSGGYAQEELDQQSRNASS